MLRVLVFYIKMDAIISLEVQLEEEVQTYREQLNTVSVRLEDNLGDDDSAQESLLELKKTLEELVAVTEERLLDAKKQKLLHVFSEPSLELPQLSTASTVPNEEESLVNGVSEEQTSFESTTWDIGDKCRAPLEQSWGAVDYHNGMIYSIDEENDMVYVMFLRPMYSKMKPCQFFLEGKCRYDDKQCRYSHGHCVPLSLLTEYEEPNMVLDIGSRCLAKTPEDLWVKGVVTAIEGAGVRVKLEGKNDDIVFDHDAVCPLSDAEEELEDCVSETEEEEVVVIASHHVAMATGFGEWEEHTKGIGSKLMAKMGYIVGQGLGKTGTGRVDPVDIVILPQRLSLDACVELREKGKLKTVEDKKKRVNMRTGNSSGDHTPKDVFAYLNSALAGGQQKSTALNASLPVIKDKRDLNIQLFKIQEEAKVLEKRIKHLEGSLQRNRQNDLLRRQIEEKLKQSTAEMTQLHGKEKALKTKFDSQKGKLISNRIF